MIRHLPYILSQYVQPLNLLLLFVGNMVGIIFGAIPGLSGTMAVMLFMPLTYTMEAGTAVIFLLSLWIGGCSGAFIGSVLLGIPGSASAVSTCWDGYPMSLKGQSGKALAIGMVASFTGTFFSSIIGCFCCVYVAELAFKLSVWEYFSLCFLAITMVVAISKGDMFKGLASASIGFILGTVGYSPIDAELRFTFGNLYLSGGLGLTIVLMGVFALSRIFVDFGQKYPPTPDVNTKDIKGIGLSFKEDIKPQMKNIIRSFGIGLGIGFLPGMGSGLSNLVAYSTEKNANPHPENFGHGEPAGIWAPEVANNASIGGALIPMCALGIPGDSATALLIGALTIHGLEMGPLVFENSGEIVYLTFITVAVCALVVLLLQSVGMRIFPNVLKIKPHYMYPVLIVICLMSSYVETGNLYKCGMMMAFCALGIFMAYGGLQTGPLILAFVLSSILEKNLLKGFQYTKTWTTFFTRPISGIMMVLAIYCMFSPLVNSILKRMFGKKQMK